MESQIVQFLNNTISKANWELIPTGGTGQESYFATKGEHSLFVKLDCHVERYEALAADGLTPTVYASGTLPNGRAIMVQQKIDGRTPTRADFQRHMPAFAAVLGATHQHEFLADELEPPVSESYQDLAQLAYGKLLQKCGKYRNQVPHLAQPIDQKLSQIRAEIEILEGGGTIVSHNDNCNANWLITPENKIFLIDLDSMSMDDPAVDLGALLWWYYPPEARQAFCEQAGYELDDQLKNGMRVRMAMHCLSILLPRENSLDRFDPAGFAEHIVDFLAVVDGKENPQGYD